MVDIEKKIVVHKISTEHNVCCLHWTQESTNNPNRYEGYLRLVSTVLQLLETRDLKRSMNL